MSINSKKITITLDTDQYDAIVSALTSADIYHNSFDDMGIKYDDQKAWIQAFKKFGLDIRE